jgi:hypothetical protein
LQVLPLVHPNAAGIDVGAKEHVLAVPGNRDPKPVRTFQAFTPDLHELAAWLKSCGIQTVALESTGIYWIREVVMICFCVMKSISGLAPRLAQAGAGNLHISLCPDFLKSHLHRRGFIPLLLQL